MVWERSCRGTKTGECAIRFVSFASTVAGLVEARKSKVDSTEEADVTLSSSEKEYVEKLDERELGLELSEVEGDAVDSGAESGDGKADVKEVVSMGSVMLGIEVVVGKSISNFCWIGVGETTMDWEEDLEIMEKISSASF